VLAIDIGGSNLRFVAADIATSVLEGKGATDVGVVMLPRVVSRPSSARK
jgi:hexokinase